MQKNDALKNNYANIIAEEIEISNHKNHEQQIEYPLKLILILQRLTIMKITFIDE